MNSAMTTERKANPTFANLSYVTKVETDHPYLLWSHRPKLAKESYMGADSEKIKTAVMGSKHTMVNTIAKLLLKIIDWIDRICVVYLRSIE